VKTLNEKLKFSHIDRTRAINEQQEKQFDLIVIGGGITGAGIFLDASLRGMRVLLVEKRDFASGTSSKSTKLIHGGLRYLKQFEFGLVRETGLERAVAHKNACHLVRPNNMLLPIVQRGTFSAFSASIAIAVYDRLAGVKELQRRKKLSKDEALALETALNPKLLKSGILYSEYRTDDARLTVEIIKAGIRNGGVAFNYMKFERFSTEDGKVSGVHCNDEVANRNILFKAKVTVNATGPWVDHIRKIENANTVSSLHLTKGVHIVLDSSKLPINNAIYFDAFDGRMLFAIPRRGKVYIGTTDTTYTSDLDSPHCGLEDAEYLLNAINKFFEIPTVHIYDVNSTWSGLRPLIQQSGKGPTELSRKDEIFISDSGLISIAGGKLTGFRTMAKRVVDRVSDNLQQTFESCKTKDYKIHHDPFKNSAAFKKWNRDLCQKYAGQFEKEEIQELCENFGKDSLYIIQKSLSDFGGDLLLSQLKYCLDFESVVHPLDFFERRIGYLYFNIEKMGTVLEPSLKFMQEYFNWPEEKRKEMYTDCITIMQQCSLAKIKENKQKPT